MCFLARVRFKPESRLPYTNYAILLHTRRNTLLLVLYQSWDSMRRIIITVGDSVQEMVHIVALLTLFIFIFSLLGMKLFSTKFWFDDEGAAVPWEEVSGRWQHKCLEVLTVLGVN